MEEKTIEAIPAIPLALMLGAINAVIGFVFGIIFAIFSAAITSLLPSGSGLVVVFGLWSIIAMPIIGFIAGFIQGLIFAVVYNFLAPRIGGIKLRFKSESPPPPPP